MKVLVADKFEKSGIEGLKQLGMEVISEPDLNDDALANGIKETGAEVLIVRSTKVTAPMTEAGNLGLIVRAGAGYNTIDVEAASKRGIYVSNCPGKNGIAVAELAFGLMLACDRHIPDNVSTLRQGKWNKKEFSKARGLFGRTLGLVGFGNIGQEMVKRAKAFGMHVVVCSRWMTPELAAEIGVAHASNVDSLAEVSDFVSVHVALTPATKGLIGKSFFERLRPGSVFVNTSRGEVVNQAAMEAMIKEKKIMVGLDVFEGEPSGGEGEYDGTLKDNPFVYCTHHIGASTDQAQEAVAAETVRIVKEFANSGIAPNTVNVSKGEAATHLLIVRYADKVGALTNVFDVLKEQGVGVQEMENIVLAGAQAAIAQIATSGAASPKIVDAVKGLSDVFDAHTIPIPG
jgi:D-3-phosphoglycerate dehydrogenase